MSDEAPKTHLDEMAERLLVDSPYAGDPEAAFDKAIELALAEVKLQMKMWGKNNERADATNREMMCAAMAQLDLVFIKRVGQLRSTTAVKLAQEDFYPRNWDGFRDYGSDVANLQVAAAYCIAEMARILIAGFDYERAPRPKSESYPGRNTPNMSSEEAARG